MITAQPIPMLSDNYAWLLHDSETGQVAIVDPAETAPAITAIEAAGGRLDMILLTHHHGDHIDGVPGLVAKYTPQVVGNANDAARLPKLDQPTRPGDKVTFGAAQAQIFDSPGHTIGHIAYYFADGGILLPGDTLFSLGCGRLFEGTAADMFGAFAAFTDLPDDTLVCAGHEYTAGNAKFALHVDPENTDLKRRAEDITHLRAEGRPTLPVSLGEERRTNPFMRAKTVEEFKSLRQQKDKF